MSRNHTSFPTIGSGPVPSWLDYMDSDEDSIELHQMPSTRTEVDGQRKDLFAVNPDTPESGSFHMNSGDKEKLSVKSNFPAYSSTSGAYTRFPQYDTETGEADQMWTTSAAKGQGQETKYDWLHWTREQNMAEKDLPMRSKLSNKQPADTSRPPERKAYVVGSRNMGDPHQATKTNYTTHRLGLLWDEECYGKQDIHPLPSTEELLNPAYDDVFPGQTETYYNDLLADWNCGPRETPRSTANSKSEVKSQLEGTHFDPAIPSLHGWHHSGSISHLCLDQIPKEFVEHDYRAERICSSLRPRVPERETRKNICSIPLKGCSSNDTTTPTNETKGSTPNKITSKFRGPSSSPAPVPVPIPIPIPTTTQVPRSTDTGRRTKSKSFDVEDPSYKMHKYLRQQLEKAPTRISRVEYTTFKDDYKRLMDIVDGCNSPVDPSVMAEAEKLTKLRVAVKDAGEKIEARKIAMNKGNPTLITTDVPTEQKDMASFPKRSSVDASTLPVSFRMTTHCIPRIQDAITIAKRKSLSSKSNAARSRASHQPTGATSPESASSPSSQPQAPVPIWAPRNLPVKYRTEGQTAKTGAKYPYHLHPMALKTHLIGKGATDVKPYSFPTRPAPPIVQPAAGETPQPRSETPTQVSPLTCGYVPRHRQVSAAMTSTTIPATRSNPQAIPESSLPNTTTHPTPDLPRTTSLPGPPRCTFPPRHHPIRQPTNPPLDKPTTRTSSFTRARRRASSAASDISVQATSLKKGVRDSLVGLLVGKEQGEVVERRVVRKRHGGERWLVIDSRYGSLESVGVGVSVRKVVAREGEEGGKGEIVERMFVDREDVEIGVEDSEGEDEDEEDEWCVL